MQKKYLLFLLLALSACSKHFVATQYTYEEKKLVTNLPKDSGMASVIKPYKEAMDKEMNVVLAISDTTLTKSQPESDLGNFMCDLILKKSREYYKEKIDFTFLNQGGIRLPNLPKGNLTLGSMIELMPFENRLVVMTLSGRTIDSLFNHMARNGGWHISDARYKIQNKKAVDIQIGNAPLDLNKNYVVVVSDYLAQGGDNCAMLKTIPFTDLKKTLRDALIEGLKDISAKGEHVKSKLDGRIQLIN